MQSIKLNFQIAEFFIYSLLQYYHKTFLLFLSLLIRSLPLFELKESSQSFQFYLTQAKITFCSCVIQYAQFRKCTLGDLTFA